MPFEQFPYTNFHELNDDWIIETVKEIKDKTENIDESVEDAKDYADAAALSESNAANSKLLAKGYADDAQASADQAAALYAPLAEQIADNTEDIAVNTAQIASIISGTTPDANVELIDIRVEYDGTTAATAGDAVREQVSDIHDVLGEVVDSLNKLRFTNTASRTVGTSCNLTFADRSTIELNGAVGSPTRYIGLNGNAQYLSATFQPNLPAGTYTLASFITVGTGDSSGTAVYYRTTATTPTLWHNQDTITFNTDAEIVYALSANKNFAGRICQITLLEGSDYADSYIPYELSANDKIARDEIDALRNDISASYYTTPGTFSLNDELVETLFPTHEMQGICTDGTYLYYVMHGQTDADTSVVTKVALSDFSIVEQKNNTSYGHANGVCYYNGMLYIVSMDNQGTIYRVNANTLEYDSQFSMQNILKNPWESYAYGTYVGVGAIAYSDELDKFVFLLRKGTSDIFWGFAITDHNFKLEKMLKCQNIASTVETRGAIDADEDYIYICEEDVVAGVRVAKVVIYNYAGAVVDVMSMSGLGYTIEGIAKTSATEYFISHSNNIIRRLTVLTDNTTPIDSVLTSYNFN